MWGCFYFIFVFLCVPTCSPSSSCVLNSVTLFFPCGFAKGEALHLRIETSILGSFKSFFFFSFFELMGQSKWFNAIKII